MNFLLKRIWRGLGILWGIVTLLFIIFYALGDPTDYLVDEKADLATRQAIAAQYGLDKPIYIQYLRYLNNLLPIGWAKEGSPDALPIIPIGSGSFAVKLPNLGRSFQSQVPVSDLLWSRLGGTGILAGAAITFAALLGITLGIISALNQGNATDQSILSGSVLGISAPSFFVGVLLAYLFAVKWQDWTHLSVSGYVWEDDIFSNKRQWNGKNLILPALALGIRPLAIFIQLTRSSLLDVLGIDYVRTAKAKGLPPWRVLLTHALQNALNPVLTAITGWLASLLAGAFFIEYIFNWQGLGKLMIEALTQNDIPVILGCALVIGIIFILVSILTDWLYRKLDPRVQLD